MASVKFKNLEIGQSYNALVWHTSSQKEPIEVKVTAIGEAARGIEVTTDKFVVREDGGKVVQDDTNKRVTFRTLDDKPDYVPQEAKIREPRGKTPEGFKAGSANAWAARPNPAPILNMVTTSEEAEGENEDRPRKDRIRKPDASFCAPADRDALSGSEHILKGPNGESVWVWDKNNWRRPGQQGIVEPRRMASEGYSYVGVAEEKEANAA